MCLIDIIFFSALHILVALVPTIFYVFLGCTGVSFILIPKFLAKAYQVVCCSPQLGCNLRILLAIIAPIPIFIWPAFVAVGSLVTALGLVIVTSIECSVDLIGVKKDCNYYNELFTKRLNKCLTDAKNILIDFYNTNNSTYINSMNDYMASRPDGHVYDIPIIQIVFGLIFFALFLPFSVLACLFSVLIRIIPGMLNHLCSIWAGKDPTTNRSGLVCCECTGCLNEIVRMCFLLVICFVLLEIVLIPLAPLIGIIIAVRTAIEMFSSTSVTNGCQNVFAGWCKQITDFDKWCHEFWFFKEDTFCPDCNCQTAAYSNPNSNYTPQSLNLSHGNHSNNNNNNGASGSFAPSNYTASTSNSRNYSTTTSVSTGPALQPSAPMMPNPRAIIINAVAVSTNAGSSANATHFGGGVGGVGGGVGGANVKRLDIIKCWDNFFLMTTHVATDAIIDKKIPGEDVENLESYLFTGVPSLVILQSLERSQSLTYPGIVMQDNITITFQNVPADSFSLQTFQALTDLRDQLKRLGCSQSEYKYLEDWVLKGNSNTIPRNFFDVEESHLGGARVRALKEFAGGLYKLSLNMSRVPTFHRRFGEALQASLTEATLRQNTDGLVKAVGRYVIKSVITSLFEF